LSGSVQANLIGLPHPAQCRIPVSATLETGLDCVDNMMLPSDQAGARHSQSPIVANGGAVIEPAYSLSSMHAGQHYSLSKIRNLPGQNN
jgi:hypothetical protein